MTSRTRATLRAGDMVRRSVPRADGVACGAASAAGAGCGSGCGTGGHWRSDWLPEVRLGPVPLAREAPIARSVQPTPDNEPACVVPPTPSISEAVGKRLRTSRLPAYGVAPSNVSSTISTRACTRRPVTCTAVRCLAGQKRQGALNHVLPQVRKGALTNAASLSRRQVRQPLVMRASVHVV